MERDAVTLFAGVPTMYFGLLNHQPERRFDLSKLRWCLAGGAPMPVEVMRAFEAKFGVEILVGFGLSETSPVASATRAFVRLACGLFGSVSIACCATRSARVRAVWSPSRINRSSDVARSPR